MTLTPSVFHETWWLDAASNGEWREVTVLAGGQVVGRLPFVQTRRTPGLVSLGAPPLTYALGPALASGTRGRPLAATRHLSILRDLVRRLPPASHVSFRLHPGIPETLGFEVEGFATRVSYTVEIEPAPEEALWRGLRDKTRNVIRRADETLTVGELDDPFVFLDFYERNLRRRRRRSFYDRRVAASLLGAACDRGAGRLLCATDNRGGLHAAIFTVWDASAAYYLMSTRRDDAHNGANAMLIWQALRHAAAAGRRLDMAGLHVRDGEVPNLLLLTGFGGAIRPRFVVSRSSRFVRVARSVVGA